jgi:repressor LexA
MTASLVDPAVPIKRRLKQLGLSQADFSKRLGKSPGWAAARFFPDVERAVRYLAYRDPETLDRMLSVLRWTPEEFARETGIHIPLEAHHPDLSPMARYRIPVVDAGAGPPMWSEEAEYIVLHIPELRGKSERELFAVRVHGDSMEPTLKERDVVVFWTQGAVEPGRIVAVHVHWDGVVIKRLQRHGDTWYLYSDNPEHPPVPLHEADKVLGVAVNLVRKI